MGKDASARDLRRETKRTLGNKLQEFARAERARLDRLEEHVDSEISQNRQACDERWLEVNSTTKRLGDRLFELERIQMRGFFGRLKWLLLGR